VLNGSAAVGGRISGSMFDSVGGASLTKTGAGTLELSATNTYTGMTTVAEGELILAGSLAGGVTVTGGTFVGDGTVVGAVSIEAGASLAPGNSVGTLTCNDNVTFASNATCVVEIGDEIAVEGDLTLNNATLDLVGTISGPTPIATVTGTIYGTFMSTNGTVLADNAAVPGQTGYYIHYEADQVVITADDGRGSTEGPTISLVIPAGGPITFSWPSSYGSAFNVWTNADLVNTNGWGNANLTLFLDGDHYKVTNSIGIDPKLFYKLEGQ